MAKSSGGAGRIGRGGRASIPGTGADRPGSLANLLRDRARLRASLPKSREVTFNLQFQPKGTKSLLQTVGNKRDDLVQIGFG